MLLPFIILHLLHQWRELKKACQNRGLYPYLNLLAPQAEESSSDRRPRQEGASKGVVYMLHAKTPQRIQTINSIGMLGWL